MGFWTSLVSYSTPLPPAAYECFATSVRKWSKYHYGSDIADTVADAILSKAAGDKKPGEISLKDIKVGLRYAASDLVEDEPIFLKLDEKLQNSPFNDNPEQYRQHEEHLREFLTGETAKKLYGQIINRSLKDLQRFLKQEQPAASPAL